MEKKLQFQLLEKLLCKPKVSENEIIKHLNITQKNLKCIILSLNENLKAQKSEISYDEETKMYALCIYDHQLLEMYYHNLQREQSEYLTQQERVKIILIHMLTDTSYVKIDDLAEQFFVSSRQISKDLQIVRKFLLQYDITIKSTPHYGLELVGSELKKRICLAEIYAQSSFSFFGQTVDNGLHQDMINEIREIISKILNKHTYLISDTVFENLVVHLFISILRIRNGYEVVLNQHSSPEKQEMIISQEIVHELSEKFDLNFSANECAYVSAHLESKRNYDTRYSENIPPEIGNLVVEILMRIDEKFQTHLRNDFQLCMILSLHCMPLLNRIKYGLNQKNPLLEEIKSRFIYEFDLATEGCKVINEKYHCEMTEDEIGYFALDIRLSLEKRLINAKYTILLVCSTGRGSAELLKLKLMDSFSQYIQRLDLCSSREAEKRELSKYDYIFTTVPLFVKTSTPILRISCFLGNKDILELNGIFKTDFSDNNIMKFFPKKLFMGESVFFDKEDALYEMVQHIKRYKTIPDNFLNSILAREREANTSFGNKVAFPHPNELLTEDTFSCVAIVKKPINWGNSKIQIIIMASIENSKNKNLQDFYKSISKIVNNKKNVERLIKHPTYETFRAIILHE